MGVVGIEGWTSPCPLWPSRCCSRFEERRRFGRLEGVGSALGNDVPLPRSVFLLISQVARHRLLDMYARKRRPGWTSWSNDLEAELGNERENVFGNKPENRIAATGRRRLGVEALAGLGSARRPGTRCEKTGVGGLPLRLRRSRIASLLAIRRRFSFRNFWGSPCPRRELCSGRVPQSRAVAGVCQPFPALQQERIWT